MGRLRLSVIGFAEPRLDKCNDLRLFLYPYKIWRSSLLSRGEQQVLIETWLWFLHAQNASCRNPRGMVCNNLRDKGIVFMIYVAKIEDGCVSLFEANGDGYSQTL